MIDFLIRTLTPRIAPMVYIMMMVSVFIGFCFMTGLLMGGGESVLYNTDILFDRNLWGLLLFFSASTAEIGFYTKKKAWIMAGGMVGFLLWLFACIGLFMAAHWYALITFGLFHLLFHGYVYLASSLNVLERTHIR